MPNNSPTLLNSQPGKMVLLLNITNRILFLRNPLKKTNFPTKIIGRMYIRLDTLTTKIKVWINLSDKLFTLSLHVAMFRPRIFANSLKQP
jgi:hypothetical protein